MKSRLSIRSSAPPIPGSKLPESFTPVLRFTIDSARSPIDRGESEQQTEDGRVRPGQHRQIARHQLEKRRDSPSSENASAPKNPSQVFFGLMCGII